MPSFFKAQEWYADGGGLSRKTQHGFAAFESDRVIKKISRKRTQGAQSQLNRKNCPRKTPNGRAGAKKGFYVDFYGNGIFNH